MDSPSPDSSAATETAADGARIVMCAHGGQLLGWTPAGGGPSRLWTSPLAVCGPGSAIRGGVPVVFPQFSDRGPLPKHGVVRDRAWRLRHGPGQASARCVATLDDDEATRRVWPHGFRLTVTAEALANRLEVVLDVENTGSQEWAFAAALHAYLAVGDAGRATVEGLGGQPAEDNAAVGAAVELPSGPLAAIGPRDVVVRGVTGPVVVDDPDYGRLVVEAQGFTDRVLWNPGEPHGLADVPPGGAASFVCVEPAVLSPVTLAPGAGWRGVMRLTASGGPGRPG